MYYRQAGNFVQYLKDTDPKGFESALKGILHGEKFRAVWKRNYGLSIPELWIQYEKAIGV